VTAPKRRRWRGNTLGEASIGGRLVGAAKEAWEQHYLAQPTQIAVRKPAKAVPPEQQAILRWLKEDYEAFDVALTLHWAAGYWQMHPRFRLTEVDAAQAYSSDVRHYLNRVDRWLYGSAHRRYGKRVSRIVALHKSPGVGWHLHAVLRTPEHSPQQEFIALLEAEWRAHLGHYGKRSAITDRLVDAAPHEGNFIGYAIRHETRNELATHWEDIGVIDWGNSALPSP
jgi:hypothetical protein